MAERLARGTECADHDPALNVAIEYKIKESRTHCFVGTVGNTLLLIQGCGKKNVGGMIDIGHALLAYGNPAESAALLHHFDVYSYRENPVTVIEESIRWTDGLIALIERIGDEKLGRAMRGGVGGEALRLICETLLGGVS